MTNSPTENIVTVKCRRCPDLITFDRTQVRFRNTCDRCKEERKLELILKHNRRIQLSADDVVGQAHDSELHRCAIRTQEEVALMLGTSPQNVQRAERAAFLHLRQYLKAERAGDASGVPTPVFKVVRRPCRKLSYAPFVALVEELLREELDAPQSQPEAPLPRPSESASVAEKWAYFRATGEVVPEPEKSQK